MLKVAVLLAWAAVAVLGVAPPGSYHIVPVDDESVVTAAHKGTEALSEKFNSKYHHRFFKVVKAEKQLVAGFNYRLNVIVGETNCAKDEIEYNEIENCEYRTGVSTYKKCTIVVYEDLQDEHHLTNFSCVLISKKDIKIKLTHSLF